MHAARAAQCGCHGRLDRFGGAVKYQPGRDDVGNHAVLDENDEQGVEHLRFIGRRQSAAQDERRHIGKSDFAHQFLVQIITAHEDAVQLRFADARDDFRLFRHFNASKKKILCECDSKLRCWGSSNDPLRSKFNVQC